MSTENSVITPVRDTTAPGVRTRPARSRAPRAQVVLVGLVLLFFVLCALVPGVFTSKDPTLADASLRMLPPSGENIFGTDQTGRDMFSRVVHGAGLSLWSGLLAVAIATGVGGPLGLVCGYTRGRFDDVVSRCCDALLAIPGLLLTLAVLSALGRGSLISAIAIGIGAIPTFTRLARAESLRVSGATFVEASRACGASPSTVLRRHVLPNAARPVISLAALEFGQAMLIIGSLSYLGFGEAPPTPEWGALIASGQPYLATAWWLSIIPGLVLALVVLTVNRAAHLLQKRA